MGLRDLLFGRRETPHRAFDHLPSREPGVAGESFRQEALERLAGGRDELGVMVPDHIALLIPEPDNPEDPCAVRVCILDRDRLVHVGYLPRSVTADYKPVFDLLVPVAIRATVTLTGGWDRGWRDRGYIVAAQGSTSRARPPVRSCSWSRPCPSDRLGAARCRDRR